MKARTLRVRAHLLLQSFTLPLRRWLILVLSAALLWAMPSGVAPAEPAQRKVVIAHRGASGLVPEHTLAAYALAHAAGADFIETDLVMTRDGVPIALHDLYLEPTTDVERVFPGRARADGHWYAADFDLAEVRRLSVHERTRADGTPVFPGRFPLGDAGLRVPTFAEAIALVQGLNRTTGCNAGLYPELKRPAFHRAAGLALEPAVLAVLTRYGYVGPDARVLVQSFEPESLRRLRALGTRLPLVQLIGGRGDFAALLADAGLREIATYAQGIGPHKGHLLRDPTLVQRAHAAGLRVHPWTFRADVPGTPPDFAAEVRAFLFTHGVDGLFTDHPHLAVPIAREGAGAVDGSGCPR